MKIYLWLAGALFICSGAYLGDTSVTQSGVVFLAAYCVCHHMDKRMRR